MTFQGLYKPWEENCWRKRREAKANLDNIARECEIYEFKKIEIRKKCICQFLRILQMHEKMRRKLVMFQFFVVVLNVNYLYARRTFIHKGDHSKLSS